MASYQRRSRSEWQPLMSSEYFDVDLLKYSYVGGSLTRTQSDSSVDRPMNRTTASNFNEIDFVAEMEISTTTPGFDIIFFGLGGAISDGAPHYEPTNSIGFRIHTDNNGNPSAVHATGRSPLAPWPYWINLTGIAANWDITGTVFRIEKIGDDVTLSIPSMGVSHTLQISALFGVLDSSSSFIYFGNGSEGSTFKNFTVINNSTPPDSDEDGVEDDNDVCADTNLETTVSIDSIDTGVDNIFFEATGCSISDLVTDIVADCSDAKNHGQFVSCFSRGTNDLKASGTLTGKEKGALQLAAAKADIPN